MSRFPMLTLWSWISLLVVLGAGSPPAFPQGTAQQGPAGPVDREAMWPAPTAEDWKKPCRITWQRTYEDAVALSEKTGKPILVCVNMDGEIASEHYAGIRYRQEEIARLYEPYVTVIASVYRHSPRDHDDAGRRVLCPRFGSVTCGEHIALEPIVYEKFLDGKRIAPRHIGVELNGEEMYDVYYAFDTASVFQQIEDGSAGRPAPREPELRGDRPVLDRVASRDSRDRDAVESAYVDGDRDLRRQLLERAVALGEDAPVELLRLAVFGFDRELSQLARQSLARSSNANATPLIVDALKAPTDAAERDQLIGALERVGESSPRARTLAVVHRGLASESESVDLEDWARALAEAGGPAPELDPGVRDSRLEYQDQVLQAGDASACVELAEAFLARAFDSQGLALNESGEREQSRLLFLDARRTAEQAVALGAADWRPKAVVALAAYYTHDSEASHASAEEAVRLLPEGCTEWNAMAVLELFAKMRCQAIARAQEQKEKWPPGWLTDVNAACAVLARHPHGTDAQVAWHHDILQWLGGAAEASRVLERGLERFPDSGELHIRLRSRIMREQGIDALEPAYESMLDREAASPSLEWFAGFASMIHAEVERRRGEADAAQAAYARGVAHFEKWLASEPEDPTSGDHYIALIHGGLARIAYEAGDDARAVAELLASFERGPDSAATLDGLNISAVDTAKMLGSRLRSAGDESLWQELSAALSALDPEMLLLPEYEGFGPAGSPAPRTRRDRSSEGR